MMAQDRMTPGLNRDNTEQRTDAGGSNLIDSGPLEHEKEFLAKSIPASGQLFTRRRALVAAGAVLILAAVWLLVIPWIKLTLNTVSTDDAYVNGHVTFVAARVSGQVSRVLVDDNNRVQKGDLLAQLDKEPYQTAVAVKQAAVDIAKADLRVATSMTRSIEAQARSERWKLQQAMEDVENRIALLHARVAALDKSKAAVTLAQLEFERAQQLLPTSATTRQEFDRRQAALSIARAGVTQALADVYQIRVSLGLPRLSPRREGISVKYRPTWIRPFRLYYRRRRT